MSVLAVLFLAGLTLAAYCGYQWALLRVSQMAEPSPAEVRDLRRLRDLVLTESHLKQLFLADILESAEPWKRAELSRDAFAEQLAKKDGSFVSRTELVAMRRAIKPEQSEAATTDTHSDVTRVA